MKQAERTGVEPVSDIELTSAPYLDASFCTLFKEVALRREDGMTISKNVLDENVDHSVLAGNTGTPKWCYIVNRPSNIS